MSGQNPIIGASVLVQREDGHVLLIERLYEPGKRLWALPGGKLEYGETVEEGAIREVKEETNIDVNLIGLLGPYDIISESYHYVTICFRGKPTSMDIDSSSEVGGANWFNPENLKETELTSTTEEALKDADILSDKG